MGIRDNRVIISVDSRKMINLLDGFEQKFVKNLEAGQKKIAMTYAEIIGNKIEDSGIEGWTGHTRQMLVKQTTNPEKEQGKYVVKVPGYIIALDRPWKKSRWVQLKPGRSITRWYKAKIGEPLSPVRQGNKRFYQKIYVGRHKWIEESFQEARHNIRPILKEVIARTRAEVS